MKSLLKIFVTLLVLSRAASACDSCALFVANGEGLVGFNASIAHQFTRFGSVWQGSHRLPNPVGQFLNSSITQLTLGYAPRETWQFQATLPYIVRSYERPAHALVEKGRVSGVGDATLAGRYILLNRQSENRGLMVAVLGGAEFGTGNANHLGDEIGGHFHHHANFPDSGIHGHDLSLGSGSTDFILGADGQWRSRHTYLRGSVQHKLRRPGKFGYRFADETSWDVAVGHYLFLTEPRTLALECVFSAEHKGLDTLARVAQLDTGFSGRYVGARLRTTAGASFAADLGGELPVRLRTTETMVVPDYRLRAAATWRF